MSITTNPYTNHDNNLITRVVYIILKGHWQPYLIDQVSPNMTCVIIIWLSGIGKKYVKPVTNNITKVPGIGPFICKSLYLLSTLYPVVVYSGAYETGGLKCQTWDDYHVWPFL